MPGKILVIDDEASIRFSFQRHLEREGHQVTTAADYAAALESISNEAFDLVFADILLPDGHTGLDILRETGDRGLTCLVIMITGVPELDTAAESVRLGAYDYLSKPIKQETLLRVTRQALRQKHLVDENARIAAEKERERRHLQAVFRSVQEGILTVDARMRVIDANETAIRFFQLAARQVVGLPLEALLDDQYGACCHVLQKTLNTREPVREYQVEFQPENQPRQVVVMNSSPLIGHDNRFLGAVLALRDITRITNLERELKDRHRFQNMIGKSSNMQEIYDLLESLAGANTTVLITGETGTGKELVAEALHYNSPGSVKPFIKVNCSALAENLLESELFGHVKGAFTGADRGKIGRFQLADGGTILLDEIGELSPTIQVKLLRVLQEKTFEKVGDPTPISVNLRVIAVTNRNLRERIRQGAFREDLYYRLKVVEIVLPPLRERREDIPLLVDHFCRHFNSAFQKQIAGISDAVLDLFMEYPWPGNIRELEHVLEYAFVLCRDNRIDVTHVPREIRECSPPGSGLQDISMPAAGDTAGEVEEAGSVEEIEEAEAIRRALRKTDGNKAKTARLLGMSRPTLYRKIEHYGLSDDTDVT